MIRFFGKRQSEANENSFVYFKCPTFVKTFCRCHTTRRARLEILTIKKICFICFVPKSYWTIWLHWNYTQQLLDRRKDVFLLLWLLVNVFVAWADDIKINYHPWSEIASDMRLKLTLFFKGFKGGTYWHSFMISSWLRTWTGASSSTDCS